MIFNPQMEFIINLTFKCNLRCKMCNQYGDGYKDNALDEMTYENWETFFYSISDVEPKPKIILMGGEPFLNKDFKRIFELVQRLGLETHIITNGLLLDKFLDILAPTKTCITISLDGLGSVHDKIRGLNGLFDKVIENIQKVEELQKNGSPVMLRINSVLLPENIDTLYNFIDYIQKFNINNFTIQHLQFSNPKLVQKTQEEFLNRTEQKFGEGFISASAKDITPKYIEQLKTALNKIKKNWNISGFIFPALNDEEISKYYSEYDLENIRPARICLNPWMTPTINPNGDVFNCVAERIGNLKEENFWNIWNNEKANVFRQSLVEHGKFDFCTKCCNFYKGNFIASPDAKLELKDGRIIALPDIINFITSSTDGVFILDKKREFINNEIPVIPIAIHSKIMYNEINEKETIIATFSDIKR